MVGGLVTGCGSSNDSKEGGSSGGGSTSSGKSLLPELQAGGRRISGVELAEQYTDETGIQVDVQTAASGTYESQLKSEMAKDEAPTLFQVNGPVGLATWKDYCYDLSDSAVYKDVSSDDYVLKEGDQVLGLAYVIETYGLIYNKAILNDYFSADWSTVKSIDDLNNFEAL